MIGGSGMLGHRVLATLAGAFDTCATLREEDPSALRPAGFWRSFRREELVFGVDAARIGTVEAALQATRPDAVVNCAGMIRQRPEAADPETVLEVNTLFPHRLARLCARSGARLVHVSTDCVFGPVGGPRREGETPDAGDLYGRSKALGEPGPPALTLRTSIIGRELARTTGLLEWFLSMRGGRVKGFEGVLWNGLTTRAMADVVRLALESPDLPGGLYHVSSAPLSKHALLASIRDRLGLDVGIEPVPVPVENRTLDSTSFRMATGWECPPWPDMLDALAPDVACYDEWRGSDETA